MEASRERLSRVVDASWKEVAEGAATPSPDPLTSPPPATAPSNSPPSSASMPTMAPTLAALSIDLEKSDLCANGALYMNIVLEGTVTSGYYVANPSSTLEIYCNVRGKGRQRSGLYYRC